MAAKSEAAQHASLPKLLTLDKRHSGFDARISEAAVIAGITLNDAQSSNGHHSRPSTTRSEFVLRWAFDKLKTVEGRKDCRNSDLIWPLLREAAGAVAVPSIARLVQVGDFVKNTRIFLEEVEEDISQRLPQPNTEITPTTLPESNGATPSKKRKRGDEQPAPVGHSNASITTDRFITSVVGVVSVLDVIISRSRSSTTSDATSQAHLASALKTSAADAAKLLNAWLQCLQHLLTQCSLDDHSLLRTYSTIMYIWDARSRDQNDETGASAKIFSSICLVSATDLLTPRFRLSLSRNAASLEIHASLEQLVAKHVFVPARTSFDALQLSKHPNLKKSRATLNEYLSPLRTGIAARERVGTIDALSLPGAISTLLDLAIRLCANASPTQQIAQVPWLESVFAVLAGCVGEPLSEDDEKVGFETHMVERTPLTDMLHTLKSRHVNLSSDFLEKILLRCSGLKDLDRHDVPLRLDLAAALLDLNGGVFLKEVRLSSGLSNGEGANGGDATLVKVNKLAYTDALMGSLADAKWGQSADVKELSKQHTIDFAVDRLLVPLMKAYTAARKLPMFISLWFWEVRRVWMRIATTSGGSHSPWLALGLIQALRDHLELSLSTTRVGELIIEFILPIRQLLDEIARQGTQNIDWENIPTTIPASAALVVLDALLHSVEREETLQDNQTAWLALQDLSRQIAMLDLTGFPAAARLWSIQRQVYIATDRVDGKEKFLSWQKELLNGDGLLTSAMKAATECHETGNIKDDRTLIASEALSFVWAVCGVEVDAELQPLAQSKIDTMLRALEINHPGKTSAVMLEHIMALCMRYPSTLMGMGSKARRSLFESLVELPARARAAGMLEGMLEIAIDAGPSCLDDMVDVLTGATTSPRPSKAYLSDHCLKRDVLRDSFAIIPESIRRPQREELLDKISDLLTSSAAAEHPLDFIEEAVALQLRLLTCPNPTAKLCTEPEKVFHLAEALGTILRDSTRVGKDTRSLRDTISSLFFAIMRQALKDATEERRTWFYNGFLGIAESRIKDLLQRARLSSESMPGLMETVTPLTNHFIAVGKDVIKDHHRLESLQRQRRIFTGTLLSSSNGKIEKSPDIDDSEQELGLGASITQSVSRLHGASAQDAGRIVQTFERKIKNMLKLARHEAIDLLVEAGTEHHLMLLNALLKQLDHASDREVLGQALAKICRVLSSTVAVERLGAAITCITTLIYHKSSAVTQHGIDALLSSLNTRVSPSAPALPSRHAAIIYIRICQLTRYAVLLHRRQLGGRMHLLISLLEKLMTCLFTPYHHQSRSLRPSWMVNLGAGCAAAYVRILTTLCSPTVSSTGRHVAGLVDEVKKAKEYVAGYVGALLHRYCALQLMMSCDDGLKKGLWSVMGIMEISAMRVMSDGMERGERAIWHSLYAEWQKIGRSS